MKHAKKSWRCFHCDEVFTDKLEAECHFGRSLESTTACQIDAKHLRALERELRRYRNEDTDLHRHIHHLEFKHSQELRREEERGYAKGLRDGRTLEGGGK